jgi:23S rRNA pseudouridine1911/1915/1917 synthase
MGTEPATTLVIEASHPGERLDRWLHARFPQTSRGTVQRLITGGHLEVDGRRVKPTHVPRAGETITIRWPAPTPAEAQPEARPLEVLFEDDCLLVINKPPDWAVHPSAGHASGTVVNALLHHCAGRLSGIGGVARPGIVHRLDKDTSGCLLVAKDDAAHLALSQQFAGREVEKVYLAIVCGCPQPEQGEIRAAIARHPTHRKRMAVTDGSGRTAWTSYRVRERLREAALVEATLHTGRTHQLRVHFKHIGCPIVGDLTYGNRQNQRLRAALGVAAPRQMLHAWRLGFAHPRTGNRIRLEAPWPYDFRRALEQLGGAMRATPA